MRDPRLFTTLGIYFSHIQISSKAVSTDATSQPGPLTSLLFPSAHTWFEFIGFSSFHLYCVWITEWPANRSSDPCPGKKHRSVRKGVEQEGWEDAFTPRRSGFHPQGGPGEALEAPVGMKDEQETTAPPGDGLRTRERERRHSMVTATKAKHLGASTLNIWKPGNRAEVQLGTFCFPPRDSGDEV